MAVKRLTVAADDAAAKLDKLIETLTAKNVITAAEADAAKTAKGK